MAGYKRLKRPGVWELTVTLGADYTGKPQRYYKTIKADTEREAEKELSRFFVECEDGFINASNVTTIEQLCRLYMDEHVSEYLKKSTQHSTKTAIDNWIVPLLGKKKISKLKKMEVQQWIKHLKDEGKSPKTIRNYYSVLCAMLDFAVKDAELIRTNPAIGCRLPNLIKKEARSYDVEQLSRILEGLEQLPKEKLDYKCGILLAIFGGFRKAEILGFNWEDVDFEKIPLDELVAPVLHDAAGVRLHRFEGRFDALFPQLEQTAHRALFRIGDVGRRAFRGDDRAALLVSVGRGGQ